MERKYFKPKSLTWWGGFVMVLAGTIKAADLSIASGVVPIIDAYSNNMSAAMLINAGLVIIGFRGKDG